MKKSSSNLYCFFGCFFGAAQGDTENRTFVRAAKREKITYADLDRESARIAGLFKASGIKKGDRIAIKTEKCVEFVFVYCACLRVGAVFLPLNPAYTAHEIEYFLSDAKPHTFVTSIPDLIERAKDYPSDFEAEDVAPEDPAAILYTSGTTGRSKGAVLTHSNLLSNAQTLVAQWGFTSDDVLIHALPLFHTHGLFVACHCVLLSGAAMIFNDKFDSRTTIEQFSQATVFMGVPTFYTRLLSDGTLDRKSTRSMRLFVSGSAPLLAETHAEFERRTGHAILERYGMTETTMLTSNPLGGPRRPGTVGPALPGVSVRIRKIVDQGIGAIEVTGPNVFKGYWQMPEKTAASFTPDGYFITGDMGSIDADGYVTISGREKDLIITGGLNVYPKEVEAVLDEVEGVRESAVVGIPHSDFGEAVVAFVSMTHSPVDTAEIERKLIVHSKSKLAAYKVPKLFIFLDELPRNTMGKVQKAELRKRNSAAIL